MNGRGLTLLEVLAALVVLSLIAITVMPIVAQLRNAGTVIENRISALKAMEEALDRIRSLELPAGSFSIQDLPGWECLVTPLPRRRGGAMDIAGREWLVVRVQGPQDSQMLERVVAVPRPEISNP